MTITESFVAQLLGISGSLRGASYNTALLHACRELLPAPHTLEIAGLQALPLYDEDVRAEGYPPAVVQFRKLIAQADGVLIATPEYNYSFSGVLKNAIDWASRPPDQPFEGKPVVIMGASPSGLGTARAQYHLRQCFVYLNSCVLNRPEVMVAKAHERFDAAGKLVDEATRTQVSKQLTSFLHAIEQLQAARQS
jgi:chromate reductase, NAD(P)H dehydrogenase (quinone)